MGGGGRRAGGKFKIVGTNYSYIKPTQQFVNRQKVNEYIAKLKSGEKVEPIEVYRVDNKGIYIEEGHHRFIASKETGIPVMIKYKGNSGPVGFSNWLEVKWKEFINDKQFWD
jgi:hypothetical protein